MSAFQVSDNCIRQIVRAIAPRSRGDHNFPFAGRVLPGYAGLSQIGRELIDMNAQAVAAVNGDAPAAEAAAGWRFRPGMPMTATEKVCAYKAIQCWLYQCCEGELPQTTLYQAIEGVKDALASEIIQGLPAFADAAWGE